MTDPMNLVTTIAKLYTLTLIAMHSTALACAHTLSVEPAATDTEDTVLL